VRYPPFWPDRPGLWFAQAEGQFDLVSVNSERMKFNYVISQLKYRHAAEFEDIIMSPPANDPYNPLKTELVRRLQHPGINASAISKPSQFLRHLKSLAPDVPDDFVRSIRSSRLPPHIQNILAGKSEGNLDPASQPADRIAEVVPLPTTASIARAPESAVLLQNIEDLSRQVAALSSQVGTLSSGRTRHRPHSRDRHKAKDVPVPAHGSADSGYSSYHRRFGDKVQRCTPPCSFRQQ